MVRLSWGILQDGQRCGGSNGCSSPGTPGVAGAVWWEPSGSTMLAVGIYIGTAWLGGEQFSRGGMGAEGTGLQRGQLDWRVKARTGKDRDAVESFLTS